MNWKTHCAAIIPSLDEGTYIADTVRGVKRFLPNVLVINDGSRDQTSCRAAEAGAQVIDHSSNQGKGVALRSGCKQALQAGFSWGLILDGDGQHAATDIPAFFDCAGRTRAAMVVGDRSAEMNQMPLVRRLTNEWMTARLSSLTGRDLPDSQCGFRLVNLGAWSQLTLRAERFEVESEWLVQFLRAGFAVNFVPVQVVYGTEESSIRPLIDSFRWFRWWLRQLCSSSQWRTRA